MEKIMNIVKVAGDITDIINYMDETHTMNDELECYSIDFDKIKPLPVDEEGNKIKDEEWIKENWGGEVIGRSNWTIESTYTNPVIIEENDDNVPEEIELDKVVLSNIDSEDEFKETIKSLEEEVDATNLTEDFYTTGQCLPIFDTIVENYKDKDLKFEFNVEMEEDGIKSRHRKQVSKGMIKHDWFIEELVHTDLKEDELVEDENGDHE